MFHVQSSGKKEVTGANILVAIFSEQDSHSVYLLNKYELTRLDIVNYLAHGILNARRKMMTPSKNSPILKSVIKIRVKVL